MLVAKLKLVSSELDTWENGCIGDSEINFWDFDLTAINKTHLIEKLKSHFNVSENAILLNSCDEVGRVDIQLQTAEKFDEYELNTKEWGQFKKGEIVAYLTTFTFEVVEQKIFDLLGE